MRQLTSSKCNLIAHLASMDLFRALDEKVLQSMAADLELVNLCKGETLFRQGDVGEALYIVVNGRLQAAIAQENGSEVVVSEVGPGELAGEVAILTGGTRTASLAA